MLCKKCWSKTTPGIQRRNRSILMRSGVSAGRIGAMLPLCIKCVKDEADKARLEKISDDYINFMVKHMEKQDE